MKHLSNQEARQFLLLKHGLLGEHRFVGKEGVLDFIRQHACVQFDPVDVCGRSADIALNSRVKGYKKTILEELLYQDRALVDYFDKNLAIIAVEDLPAFLNRRWNGSYAAMYQRRGGEAVARVKPLIRELIAKHGHVSAADVCVEEKIIWDWDIEASVPRAALESMYLEGELLIHHKNGTHKNYAFMKDHIPAAILNAPPPFSNEEERLAWHIQRRIAAVGLLWNRVSDAWLGLSMKSPERTAAFERLREQELIWPVSVEGLKDPLYFREADRPLLETVLSGVSPSPRCELIAPLDNLIWDRKLIRALFDFDYKWEIYTPAEKRRFGAYVLPLLYGDRFIGRVETSCDRKAKTLRVKQICYEEGVAPTKKLQTSVKRCLQRFAVFNGCAVVEESADSGRGIR